ncbi:signal recognition particle, SRP19 subunit [Crepidotus variabilis]|uniref:Signal recognition particle, SRP19 subunit n=1 Tax=Crepidotus variabilis TaxID=179855 RepID=A0A9P6EEV3_9AGAR|nr:signal recognition particle, SRP19 subunit [Crepidotus variabilis]
MSRKAAVIEEFDDDTDLPLPNVPLPNTGARGPILQEVDDSDEDDFEPASHAGPASPPRQPPSGVQQQRSNVGPDGVNRVTDITPYKSWSCIYPIYIDAKRPCGRGQRRVPRGKALWWPVSKDIAETASNLGLGTLHEVNKSHPRDWENPGRVRVQWKKDGKLMNPAIKTKKQLLEMICYQLQILKPENIPKPPYNLGALPISAPFNQTAPDPTPVSTPAGTAPSGATAQQKGKAPASKPKVGPTTTAQMQQPTSGSPSVNLKPTKRLLPLPPDPLPSVSNRLSVYSPTLASNVLIETVKAGMNTQPEGGPGGPGTVAPPGGMGKGKRKVVRVRQ